MTDTILALVPTYGLSLLIVIVALSCLALPVPSSLVMLTSGSFVGAGDLAFVPTLSAALLAAITGDQIGYQIGRWGGAPLLARIANTPERHKLLERARAGTARRGGTGVFFSRWLVSPLGPYVNFIAGATGLSWMRFTAWGAAGELVWVTIYIGLGYAFADNISAVAELAGDMSGLLAAGAVTLFLGWRLMLVLKNNRHHI